MSVADPAPDIEESAPARRFSPLQWAGFLGGIVLFAACLVTAPPAGLSVEGWRVVGVAGLMALWWSSEALPVSATALVPLAFLPLLGIADLRTAAAPYAHPLVFLFLGGFILARGLARWGLHRRLALNIALAVGTRPDQLILGFMFAAAGLSLWISNTATTVMMVPLAVSVIGVVTVGPQGSAAARDFGPALMLGLAYGATIGGMGTLIGSPPNAFMAAFMAEDPFNRPVAFAAWSAVALPVAAVLLPLVWWFLTRVLFPGTRMAPARTDGADVIRDALAALGPWRVPEIRMGIVFLAVAFAWLFSGLLRMLPGLAGLSDTVIGMLGALALFTLPAGPEDEAQGRALLTWEEAVGLPWGVLILFGGGLSLAAAIGATDLAVWIGGGLEGLGGLPLPVLMLIVAALIMGLTELMSNLATTAAFLPIIAALAVAVGIDPLFLAMPAALAASCAFMLPVATPPNAVVFSSGHITIPQMVRAGFWVNVMAVMVATALTYVLVPIVFG